MPGALLEIRKKVDGVKNTRKITKAMQLVAASKMKQFQRRAVAVRSYAWDVLEILEQHLEDLGQDSIYTEERSDGPILFVLYTSDKGLCGPLNAQIIKTLIRSEVWAKTSEKLLITIGKKSLDFARSNKIPVEKSFMKLQEKLTPVETLPVIDAILRYWLDRKCQKILFVSPHFKNSFLFYPVVKTLLPFSLEMVESHFQHVQKPSRKKKEDEQIIYEPLKTRVLESLVEQVIQSIFLQSFYELKASEYSSRMLAMQNATDSADRILHELTLTFNKTRQQVITQELSELIGASEAISKV